MFVGQNNGEASVGINKMPEQGALDVEGDIYSNGNKVVTDDGTGWIGLAGQMEVDGELRKLYMVTGTGTISLSAGESDVQWDTGKSKFPTQLVAGGMTRNWQDTSWNYTLDAWDFQNSSTNIKLSLHTSETTGPTSLSVAWWAIGY
jgi:hypothetical protein